MSSSGMNDFIKHEDQKDTSQPRTSVRVFIEFKYPEIKDLLKHFLTLISGALVFSITFSEKIIGLDKALNNQKKMILAAWFILVLALGACGLGLYTLYLAAEQAVDSEVDGRFANFEPLVGRSYLFQDAAGLLFGLGLC